MNPSDYVWLPVDVASLEEARRLIGDMREAGIENFKVGLELMTWIGAPRAVTLVQDVGGNVWLDGKFCDIPNTVAGASKAAAALGVNMFNVHASCGKEAMIAAAKAKGNAKLLAVTVLTSLKLKDFEDMGLSDWDDTDATFVPIVVQHMARNAQESGCDGVVCSPQELLTLNLIDSLKQLLKVTPGVRPQWAAVNDQKRIMTPAEAMKAGASALVIGRPITNPPQGMTPKDAVQRIFDEIASAV
jgi:orotidine-5'-phosphate decarboxylase